MDETLHRIGAEADLLIRMFDSADFWLFVVLAALIGVLMGQLRTRTARDLAALRMMTATAGVCYFVHLLRVRDFDGADYVTLGARAFLFAMIVQGIAGLVFCVVILVCDMLQATWHRTVTTPCWKLRRWLSKVFEPKEKVSPIEPEPTQEELEAQFEQKLDAVRRKFMRRCEIINEQKELTDPEREGAITKARSEMTFTINEIMEHYG